MKWNNMGHEFDSIGKELSDQFTRYKKVFIFGAGVLGAELKPLVEEFFCFSGFIDNNQSKQKKTYKGSRVYSLLEYTEISEDSCIVIAADQHNITAIKEQLEDYGFKQGQDFFELNYFVNRVMPVLSVYLFNKSYMELVQISLTERCSLRCKKCAHACYAVKHDAEDMQLVQVYNSADTIFKKVDFIKEFVLIGGEPLLYKKMDEVIAYIGNHYRNKMSIFSITTNGTIMPSRQLLEKCKRYDMTFRISNYSLQIPRLKRKYEALTSELDKYQISYTLAPAEFEWMDYGFEYVNRQADRAALEKVFDACRTPCREVRGNKLYYCVMARSVSDNLNRGIGKEDYLDLNALDGIEAYKKILLEFNMGYSEKGYLDMCNYCHGAEACEYPIPAAEQMEG